MRSRHQCLLAFRYAAIYGRALIFLPSLVSGLLLRRYRRRVRLIDLLPMSDCRMFPSICALISLGARRSLCAPHDVPCRCDRSRRPVAPVMRNTTKLPEPVIPELLGCDTTPPFSSVVPMQKLSNLDVVLLPYILPQRRACIVEQKPSGE